MPISKTEQVTRNHDIFNGLLDVAKNKVFSIALKAHVVVDLPNGELYFPTLISCVDGEVTRDYAIVKDSIRINHSISPALFTLSHSMASTVDDFDRNMERLISSGALQLDSTSLHTTGGFSYIYFILFVTGIVIAVATLAILRRKFR